MSQKDARDMTDRGSWNPNGQLDPQETTVHEAIAEIPDADEVFRRFGIDTCCGGELPLAVAAEHHEVELQALLEALADADART